VAITLEPPVNTQVTLALLVVAFVVPDKAFCLCPGTDLALRLEELTTSHDNGDNGFATRTAQ